MNLDELRTAVDNAAWPRALVLAIDAWREWRVPQLGDLVDRISRRLELEHAPKHRVQPWWVPRARKYDPIVATSLVASASDLAHKSDVTWEVIAQTYGANRFVQRLRDAVERTYEVNQLDVAKLPMFRGLGHRNLLERLAVLATWPADPRVTHVLATWFADAKVVWQFPHDGATLAFYDALAEEILALRDARAIPLLERTLAEPRGKTIDVRERQRALATRVIDELAAHVLATPPMPDELAAELARWCPLPAEEPPVDEPALWAAAASPEDLDARLVLADFLLERGDRRGEIITLACSGSDDNARRGSSLLHEYWDRWMGELALVLDRGHCTFVGGMLDIATIGIHSTPEWAYPKVARHRELASVRIVRPGWNASERGYVAFLDAMRPLPSRVRINATMIDHLARTQNRWAIRELELVTNLPDLECPLAELLDRAAAVMPDVELVEFPAQCELDDNVIAAIARLPEWFPAIARVHVDAAIWLPPPLREALADLATRCSFVVVDHGTHQR